MKPGHWPDLEKMERTIEEAGYTPMPEANVLVVTGKVVRQNERLLLELDGMRVPKSVPLAPSREAPEAAEHLGRHLGQSVELEGRWLPEGGGALAVTAIRRAGAPAGGRPQGR